MTRRAASDQAAGSRAKTTVPVVVDADLCKACGICVGLCPTQVFDRDPGGRALVARPEACTRCLLCELHCPDFAIAVERRPKKRAAAAAAAAAAGGKDEDA